MPAINSLPTDLLFTRLPSPPCHLLAIGSELEASSSLLELQGYHVQCMYPYAPPTDLMDSPDQDILANSHAWESFEAPAGRFDAVVVAHHIEPLVTFNLAIDCLPFGGDLIIVDRFVHVHDALRSNRSFVVKEIIALAERCGFDMLECIDASSERPVSQHENDRHAMLGLIHFRKKTPPKWRIRILGKAQIDDMRDLFQNTFHHEMSRAFWEWKYGPSSARGLGVWENDDLIAHYGGMGRKIMYFGQPQSAVQIGDVMVDSSKRGILTKKGPIFLMMATFLERYIGYGKPYLIGYGFPNDRHMKLAEILGLYAEVGHMVECSWRPRTRFPLWNTRLQLIQHLTDAEKMAIDLCWQRMAVDMTRAIIGIRDWRYLEQRYLNHPEHDYRILLIKNRFSGKVRGAFVLRLVPEGCELVDCVAALSDIPLIITHARRLASIHGATRLFCRITANFAHLFEVADAVQQPVNIRIPTNIWSHGPSAEAIKNHWWLMSGDMDFR